MQEEWKYWKTTYNKNGEIRTYEISSFGNVKINGNYFNPTNSEYYYLAGELLHRIVAELFIPNPDNKPCVDHIDTNKHNNRVDNLRWCTYSENMQNVITYNKLQNIHKSDEYRQHLSRSLKGVNLGFKHSDETKQKMSKSHIGKSHIVSDDTKRILSTKISHRNKGKIWINNGVVSKFINPNDLQNYQGYTIGRIDINKGRKYSEKTKDKLRQSHIGKAVGKIWINNSIESKMIFPQDIDKYIGYVKGRCKK